MKSKISEKNVKEKIAEQDKIKLEFKRKLASIKEKYGLDFDVDMLDNNEIDRIKFYNLKYKNKARDLSLIYYNESNYYGAYIYKVNKDSTLLDENYITKKNYLDKKYKLPLAIEEIKQINLWYKKSLDDLNKKYEVEINESPELEKELKLDNNTES